MSTNIDKLIEEKDVFDKVFLLYGEEKYLKNIDVIFSRFE